MARRKRRRNGSTHAQPQQHSRYDDLDRERTINLALSAQNGPHARAQLEPPFETILEHSARGWSFLEGLTGSPRKPPALPDCNIWIHRMSSVLFSPSWKEKVRDYALLSLRMHNAGPLELFALSEAMEHPEAHECLLDALHHQRLKRPDYRGFDPHPHLTRQKPERPERHPPAPTPQATERLPRNPRMRMQHQPAP